MPSGWGSHSIPQTGDGVDKVGESLSKQPPGGRLFPVNRSLLSGPLHSSGAALQVHERRVSEMMDKRQTHRVNEVLGEERRVMQVLEREAPHMVMREIWGKQDQRDRKVNNIGYRPKAIDILIRFPPETSDRAVMRDENLEALPLQLESCAHLTYLDVSTNFLREISPALSQLRRLEHLNVSANELIALPDSLHLSTQLQVLNARNNRIIELPQKWSGLNYLRDLDLSFNPIEAIPSSIEDLFSLERLDVSHCQLRALPDAICTLSRRFASLRAGFNFIFVLPRKIGNLKGLQELYLPKNLLSVLPQGTIEYMTGLQKLDVSQNRLASIPRGIGLNYGLRELVLSCNQIDKAPRSLMGLTNLNRLDLSSNQIGRIPEITQLLALTELRLDNNNLRRLPVRLHLLTNLTSLEARGNPKMEVPPNTVIFQGMHRILEYLKDEEVREHRMGVHDERLSRIFIKFIEAFPTEMDLVRGFQEFDEDDSGCMDLREFNSWMFAVGIDTLSVEDISFVVEALDDDRSGNVEIRELVQMYRRFSREKMQNAEEEDEMDPSFLLKEKDTLIDAEMNDAANEAAAEAAAARKRMEDRKAIKAAAAAAEEKGKKKKKDRGRRR